MAVIIGPSPGTNFTIYPGASVRHSFWWGPLGNGAQRGFAMPPNIATAGNRVVSSNQAVEEGNNGIVYTADARCEDIVGTGRGAAYQIIAGTLAWRGNEMKHDVADGFWKTGPRAYPAGLESGDSQRSADERVWRP